MQGHSTGQFCVESQLCHSLGAHGFQGLLCSSRFCSRSSAPRRAVLLSRMDLKTCCIPRGAGKQRIRKQGTAWTWTPPQRISIVPTHHDSLTLTFLQGSDLSFNPNSTTKGSLKGGLCDISNPTTGSSNVANLFNRGPVLWGGQRGDFHLNRRSFLKFNLVTPLWVFPGT